MSGDPERFLSLATTASDGGAIDWEREAGRCTDERDRRLVRALELLASVLEEHRRLHVAREGNAIAGAAPGPGGNWGPLRILGEIGSGSFATVYRAHDPKLDRVVALKVWPARQEMEEGIVAEARLMARVRHPNVAAVYGADVHDGQVGLFMELVEGTSLAEHVRERGPLGARETISAGIELCAALAAVHAAGVAHGDLKSENVVRERGGRLVLTDFGSGRDLLQRVAEAGSRTSGTPLFMAPEILCGGPKSIRADVYSLGVLLFHLLTGRYPQEAATVDELRAAHARRAPRLLRDLRPDLSPGLVAAVSRALAADPEGRFAGAGDFEQALVACLSASRSDRSRTAGRRPILLGASFAVAALVLVVIAITWRAGRTGKTPVPAGGAAVPKSAPWVAGVSATLYRVGAAGDEALAGGETMRQGDRLYLQMRSEDEVSVYVVNIDRRGRGYVLFPVEGAEWSNPLASGATYRLPGSAAWEHDSWEVSSAGGKESIVVVASRHRLERLEAALVSARAASASDPWSSGHPAQDALRGVGRLADAARHPDAGATAIEAALRELTLTSFAPGDIVIREYVFENP